MQTLNFNYSSDAYYISNGKSYIKTEFHFQKIIDIRSHSTIYYEVLSLLTHQSGETFENSDFFDSVDGQFIKKLSLIQLKYARRKKLPHPPTINLTLSCLEDSDFITEILSFSDLKYALEINDIDVNIDNPLLRKNLYMLKSAGIKLWLDNYSLDNVKANTTLGEIEWDRIKIEISTIKEFGNTPNMLSSLLFVLAPFVVEGIVVEGIETEQESESISNFSAFGQGYYYHFPTKLSLI
ncbi:Putative diguanylate phosphodiesterase [Vibrio sp. B1REV9]|uniref:EAL domain-containing protein n=1 Tax=Vibrio sp. B1REV9 TaxID=2751179 RepID=UPI001AF1EE47|nr:EAL domain-containing protein [Vibrio sp. B1REV9]CAE6899159.1 Putative diguanylate phosphodiesterase [Vibrio sp. B1REV9]